MQLRSFLRAGHWPTLESDWLGPTPTTLAALGQALQNGYKDLDNLKKDQDLDPLRSRDEFKKLVADLEGKRRSDGKGTQVR
jgi:hypothetical protein